MCLFPSAPHGEKRTKKGVIVNSRIDLLQQTLDDRKVFYTIENKHSPVKNM